MNVVYLYGGIFYVMLPHTMLICTKTRNKGQGLCLEDFRYPKELTMIT